MKIKKLTIIACAITLLLFACKNNSNDDTSEAISNSDKSEESINKKVQYDGTYEWNLDDMWILLSLKGEKWSAEGYLQKGGEFSRYGIVEGKKLVITSDEFKGQTQGWIHQNGLKAYIRWHSHNEIILTPAYKRI